MWWDFMNFRAKPELPIPLNQGRRLEPERHPYDLRWIPERNPIIVPLKGTRNGTPNLKAYSLSEGYWDLWVPGRSL